MNDDDNKAENDHSIPHDDFPTISPDGKQSPLSDKKTKKKKKLSSILGGEPLPDPDNDSSLSDLRDKKSHKSFHDWMRVFALTWTSYKLTWEGFLSSSSSSTTAAATTNTSQPNDIQTVVENQMNEMEEKILEKAQHVHENFKTNIETLQQTSQDVLQYAKDKTQIQNKTDLKRWMMIQMQLATEMLREFMKGYRQAREDEMERTITQYFKDLDEQEGPPNKKDDDTHKEDEAMKHGGTVEGEKNIHHDNLQKKYISKRKTTRRLYQWVEEKRQPIS